MWQGRPTWAEIDLDAIAHNVRELRHRAGGVELIAAVKANGYGHGAVPVARAALEAGATRLSVACVDEGVQLRQAGIAAPILVMGYASTAEADTLVDNDLTATLGTRQLALALAARAAQKSATVTVHLKVDTGMNRFGLPPEEVAAFYEFLKTLPAIRVEGLYTHFASADEVDKSFTQQQFARFLEVAQQLPDVRFRHVANSAAILDLPELALEGVRPGIALYGLYPSAMVIRDLRLLPALTLKTRVARLRTLAAGESVSYGRTWTAAAPARIALLPCGYGDGLRRGLSNQGEVLIRGRRAPIRGRVCMDQCIAEVTHVPDVAIDEEVVIIGRQGEDEIAADEVARRLDTINYEVTTGIAARVPRVYLRRGEPVAVVTLNVVPATAFT